ncbi:MAG: hypothetical protein GY753_16980 [Gammaproteobacteria bacterium]|nr:hypothetical protein [Gammaproteobacteria bacterium]
MTRTEILEAITQSDLPSATMTLSPGPYHVVIGAQDKLAAHFLLMIYDNSPADLTLGQLDGILASMTWWNTFFNATREPTDNTTTPDSA